jgi:hypothetical protein
VLSLFQKLVIILFFIAFGEKHTASRPSPALLRRPEIRCPLVMGAQVRSNLLGSYLQDGEASWWHPITSDATHSSVGRPIRAQSQKLARGVLLRCCADLVPAPSLSFQQSCTSCDWFPSSGAERSCCEASRGRQPKKRTVQTTMKQGKAPWAPFGTLPRPVQAIQHNSRR